MSEIRKPLFAAALLSLISLSVQAQGWQVPQPSPGLMPNPATGKPLFEKFCAACHGVDLKGSENGLQKGSQSGPPLLHRIYEPSHHADAAFQLAVKNGVRAHHWQFGDMAPVPQVSPDDVAHITAYVRAEQRKVGIR
jgi:cytochrome c